MGFQQELGTELRPKAVQVWRELGTELGTRAQVFPAEKELGLELGVRAYLIEVCRELGMELRTLEAFLVVVLHTRWQGCGNKVQWMELCTI